MTVCYSNGYGVTKASAGSTTTWEKPAAPGDGTYTYAMGGPANGQYLIETPTTSSPVPADFEAHFDGYDESTGSDAFGVDPGIRVRYCTTTDDTLCSDWSTVTAADSSRAWQVRFAVAGLSTAACVIGGTLEVAVDATASGLATAVVTRAEFDVPNPNGGRMWEYRNTAVVPGDATQVKNVTWTITWTAPETAGLATVSDVTQSGAVQCIPAS